ncbi:MAG: phosphoglucosamine mutase [Bacillota bacterium]
MGKLFGTDGVRGVANRELTPELAYKLGRVGAYLLTNDTETRSIVIGRDTRVSGDMLEAALIAGICSVGVNVLRAGIIPTPAVAYLTRAFSAGGGVVISASHNPYEDNGIKFFGANGCKLPDAVEEEIERFVLVAENGLSSPTGDRVGRVFDVNDADRLYINFAKGAGPASLKGLRIVVDCANGAAYRVGPRIFKELGAEVIPLAVEPDGLNINVGCGSTNPARLQQEVVRQRADLGLAFDGDADRVIAVDEQGNIVDGDQIMVICAKRLKEQGRLAGDTLVATVMSNLGLHLALQEAGIKVLQTKVGDRYVLEELLRTGTNMGGEQSGHIIFLDHNTTGDGILTSMQLLNAVTGTGQSLGSLAGWMERLPQILENIRVREKETIMNDPRLEAAIQEQEARLAGQGRILVRPSGTEPLIRVMVEGRNRDVLMQVVNELVKVIREIER